MLCGRRSRREPAAAPALTGRTHFNAPIVRGPFPNSGGVLCLWIPFPVRRGIASPATSACFASAEIAWTVFFGRTEVRFPCRKACLGFSGQIFAAFAAKSSSRFRWSTLSLCMAAMPSGLTSAGLAYSGFRPGGSSFPVQHSDSFCSMRKPQPWPPPPCPVSMGCRAAVPLCMAALPSGLALAGLPVLCPLPPVPAEHDRGHPSFLL